MKKLILTLALFSFIFTLIGCGLINNNDISFSGKNVVEIGLSESLGFGKVNTDFSKMITDKDSIQVIVQAIETANKEPGIVNIMEPEYDILVSFDDNKTTGYHLWLGEKGQTSTLMDVEDTHTIYTLEAEMTEKLLIVITD